MMPSPLRCKRYLITHAAKCLLSLRQGSHSAAELAINFHTLAESGWNDEMLQGAFQNVLNGEIKDELLSRDEPESLDQLVSLAIKTLHESYREKAAK